MELDIYTTHCTVFVVFAVGVHEAGYIHDTRYNLRCVRCGSV